MAARNAKHLKMILAIAQKDIGLALKDRMILGVIIGVFLLILPSQLLPIILQNETTPRAVIYGSEPTALSNGLTQLADTSAYSVTSLPDLKDEIASGRSSIIGLVLPEEFLARVKANQKIKIEAYVTHWTKPEDANRLVAHFEDKVHALTGSPVDITIVDDQVYPDEDTRGIQVMFILQLINAVMTITLILVPQLIIQEKETHTLDALLVSPANLPELIIGKGLVGIFYATVAVSIVVSMNLKIIAHWPLFIMSIFSGIILAVLLGLLIGIVFGNYQQASITMWFFGLLAIAPPFIILILTADLPNFLDTIINWIPSGQLANLLLMSLMKSVDNQTAFLGLGSIWIVNLILFALNLWQIKVQMK